MTRRRIVPAGGPNGELLINAGRYARESVLTAFEMIGGVDRLADWADKNPGEFFTKMFPKVIGREVEHGVSEGVESLLDKLDQKTLDGEFEVVDGDADDSVD